jgi:adenylate cyclase class 2
MSAKRLEGRGIDSMKEATITVNSFDDGAQFLLALGLVATTYQETRRESWRLGNVAVELDTWPWVPSFMEIEAATATDVKAAATALGLNWSDARDGGIEPVYQAVYDITPAEIQSWKRITFSNVPKWLANKRKDHQS